MIRTRYEAPTSRYMCDGSCVHYPALAEAWEDGKPGRVSITSEQTGLVDSDLVEKAVALFRNRKRMA